MLKQDSTFQPLRVLVIAAHPDDIEFGAAGTIAQWTDAGAYVAYCIITDGAAGSNDPGADPNEVARIRYEEQRASARVLGVQEVVFLNHPDGILQPTLELRRDLTRVIRKFKPNRVLCQDPTLLWEGDGEVWNFINHPDHRAAGEAALFAVFPSAESRPIFPELLKEGLEPHHVGEVYLMTPVSSNLLVDISKYMDRKIESLLCHQSQVDACMIPTVQKWNAERAQRIGGQYAERFQTIQY